MAHHQHNSARVLFAFGLDPEAQHQPERWGDSICCQNPAQASLDSSSLPPPGGLHNHVHGIMDLEEQLELDYTQFILRHNELQENCLFQCEHVPKFAAY